MVQKIQKRGTITQEVIKTGMLGNNLGYKVWAVTNCNLTLQDLVRPNINMAITTAVFIFLNRNCSRKEGFFPWTMLEKQI